jgi:opacity protein-like surface antigen
MSKSRWLLVALICSFVAMPTISNAQVADSTKEQAQDFVHDVLHRLLGPNKNLFVNGGFTRGDRFVLQQAVNTIDGQRALNGATGWNVGGGIGVDFLLRTGLRLGYTFSSRDLNFKTDNGNGSDALDIDDVGTIRTHTASLELMRYMLPSRTAISPYGTIGIQGTWWVLTDQANPIVLSNGKTPFSFSPMFSFGVQFKATNSLSGRLEATLSSGHNPFTGKNSFRALSGPTIDEPTDLRRSDYRLAGVYYFGKEKAPAVKLPVAKK